MKGEQCALNKAKRFRDKIRFKVGGRWHGVGMGWGWGGSSGRGNSLSKLKVTLLVGLARQLLFSGQALLALVLTCLQDTEHE